MRILPPTILAPTDADIQRFSAGELTLGWRLACRHKPRPHIRVELPSDTGLLLRDLARKCEQAILRLREEEARHPARPARPARASLTKPVQYGLAVDLGTTTLQWRLTRLACKKESCSRAGMATCPVTAPLWEGEIINPQMASGSDVVSRLKACATSQGQKNLQDRILDTLKALVENSSAVSAEKDAIQKRPAGSIVALCLAGNPAMTAICLGKDTQGLASAPYSLPLKGGQWVTLPYLPEVWVPPQFSPFVGGDIAAGYAALALNPAFPPPAFPFLLADMGTNGEFLLALSPNRALVTSVALGPALEGIGLSCGSEARPGAIVNFTLSPYGLVAEPFFSSADMGKNTLPHRDSAHKDFSLTDAKEKSAIPPINPLPPFPLQKKEKGSVGITGTGYISLLHILAQTRVMTRDGHFKPQHAGSLARFFKMKPGSGRGRGTAETRLLLPHSLFFTAGDVEALLKVKAAFSLALARLLEFAGVASHDLTALFVAGAMGRHMNKRALDDLGFFPPGIQKRLHAVGNSSLDGATLLLRHPPARKALAEWSEGVRVLDLAADPAFNRDFTSYMRFFW